MEDVLSDRRRAEVLFRAQAEHRIKTSLALISGWAATLDDEWDRLADTRRREGMAIIRRASDDLAEQTSRLLLQTRAELLSFDLQPVDVEVGALLDITAHALNGVSDEHRCTRPPVPRLASGSTRRRCTRCWPTSSTTR
jgi:signal transduction histidine kinase